MYKNRHVKYTVLNRSAPLGSATPSLKILTIPSWPFHNHYDRWDMLSTIPADIVPSLPILTLSLTSWYLFYLTSWYSTSWYPSVLWIMPKNLLYEIYFKSNFETINFVFFHKITDSWMQEQSYRSPCLFLLSQSPFTLVLLQSNGSILMQVLEDTALYSWHFYRSF